jgi:hypothetical protein
MAFGLTKKKRDVFLMAGGMAALLAGRKVSGLAMFAKGALGLEKQWRLDHPEFRGTLEQRWQKALEFYDSTHKDPVNRKLHIIGIPMIVGGAAGLLLFSPYRPLWFVSASSFSFGWLLNFIGHGFFEKNAPAFADDPLSFLAGPIWDMQQVFGKGARVTERTVTTDAGEVRVINVENAEPAVA